MRLTSIFSLGLAISPFACATDVTLNLGDQTWTCSPVASFTERVRSGPLGVPKSLRIEYDLNQKHVRVSREKVAQQFITDIQQIGRSTIESMYIGSVVEVINDANGPGIRWKDISLALSDVWITDASEVKTSSGSGRSQKDKAKGYASFSVREHPTAQGHPNVKEFWPLVKGFEQTFSAMVDQHLSGGFYIPCEIIPGKECPSDDDDIGPFGPTWPIGHKAV
ncbi:hypothetical protein N7499_006270 [Penicillium canescens]|nr:hypothetical protein N7499_006270 [Penicillium canescens]KAJ6176807.1 hypothetical protein N7485_003721 [Penicillium canescens]